MGLWSCLWWLEQLWLWMLVSVSIFMNRRDIVSLMEAYEEVSIEKPSMDVSLEEPQEKSYPEPEIKADYAELKDMGQEQQRMAKTNLHALRSHANEILNIIDNGVLIEPWMEEKVAIASDYIITVANAIMYRK